VPSAVVPTVASTAGRDIRRPARFGAVPRGHRSARRASPRAAEDRDTAARWAEARVFIIVAGLDGDMPATLEVKCTDSDCEMDMFEMHYTYDMPDDVGVEEFACPYCRGTDCLEAIEL
jgi:hypothetical protein